jgi:hypothetical protein
MNSLKRFGWQRKRWSCFYERSTVEYPNLLVHAGTPKITYAYPQEPCLRKRKHKNEAVGNSTRILLQYYQLPGKIPGIFRRVLEIFAACHNFFRRVRKIVKSYYWLRHVCLSVPPSVRMEQLGSHRTAFHEVWHLTIFQQSVGIIQVSLKSDKNNGYLTWRPIYIFFITSRSVLLGMRNVSGESCTGNQNTHFVFNNVFLKSCRLCDYVENYHTAGQDTDDNTAYAQCMLDT